VVCLYPYYLEYFCKSLIFITLRSGNLTLDDYIFTSDDQLIEGETEEGKRYTKDELT